MHTARFRNSPQNITMSPKAALKELLSTQFLQTAAWPIFVWLVAARVMFGYFPAGSLPLGFFGLYSLMDQWSRHAGSSNAELIADFLLSVWDDAYDVAAITVALFATLVVLRERAGRMTKRCYIVALALVLGLWRLKVLYDRRLVVTVVSMDGRKVA